MTIILTSLCVSACTIIAENKRDDARKIAMDTFHMDEILVVTGGTSGSILAKPGITRNMLYVLGKKDGEDMFIVVPALKRQSAYQVDWVFKKSLEEIITELNSTDMGEICSKDDFKNIEFIDNPEGMQNHVPALEGVTCDIDFMIVVYRHSIVQIGGEIAIYGEGFNSVE